METRGYGYVRRLPGVDVGRLCTDLRERLEYKGFGLFSDVIVDGDGSALPRLLRLIASADTAGPVFVPHVRHLRGRLDLVLLYVPVYATDPWLFLERRPAPDAVVSSR